MRCERTFGARTCCANTGESPVFARHANGQTSAERTPAPLRPRVPRLQITKDQNTADLSRT